MKLSQSRGILRIDSEILPDGVFYSERGLLSSNETKVPFEQIAPELIRTFHVPRLYLFITLFFALALCFRAIRFATSNAVSISSLLWSGILFMVPALGTWMQSPQYVGYLTTRGGLLFFDKRGPQDPTGYLEAIQQAREAYLRSQYQRGNETQLRHDGDSDRSQVH